MEHLFTLEYGIGGACVLLTLTILMKVGEFLWKLKEQKDHLSEATMQSLIRAVQENTGAMQLLEHRLRTLEANMSEVPKLKTDLRRFYAAVKEIAGERWPAIRDEIVKDGFDI